MKKTGPMLRWAGMSMLTAVLLFSLQALADVCPGTVPGTGKPDQITINTLAAFEKVELPPVTYFHDKHTDALAKENISCDACHYVEDNKMSFSYLRRKTTKPEEIQGIYHTNCIGCHNDMIAAGKKSGPQDGFCRSCHNAEPPASLAKLDAGMDKVLHWRHLDSKQVTPIENFKENCSACHHQYDQAAKKLVYVKGQEGNCRYCHKATEQQGVPSLQQASHEQCLQCHLDLTARGGQEPMPVNCRGCHGAAAQAEMAQRNKDIVAKLPGKQVPRLLRGQPDATLVMYDPKAAGDRNGKAISMPPVPFNHLAHEQYSDNCRACHHASMDSCSKCHTLGGSKEGGYVTFQQSMHHATSQASCTGCHAVKLASPNCAGCHNGIAQARPAAAANCQQCHMPVPGTVSSPQQKSAIADTMLKNRKTPPATYPAGEIPDKVTIKELCDKYEPVEMAHLKHVNKLMEVTKDSHLAAHFHSDPGTMCQGCHHHSPASKTPPHCINCHALTHGQTAFDPKTENPPGLLAAHHNQCMSCHKDMSVKPVATACTECHLEKKKLALGAK